MSKISNQLMTEIEELMTIDDKEYVRMRCAELHGAIGVFWGCLTPKDEKQIMSAFTVLCGMVGTTPGRIERQFYTIDWE